MRFVGSQTQMEGVAPARPRIMHELAGAQDRVVSSAEVFKARLNVSKPQGFTTPIAHDTSGLLFLAALGRRFYSLGERLGVFRAMYPPVEHIIPSDVGIEMMLLSL